MVWFAILLFFALIDPQSFQLVLWIGGGLFAVIGVLVGFIMRSLHARQTKVEADQVTLTSKVTTLENKVDNNSDRDAFTVEMFEKLLDKAVEPIQRQLSEIKERQNILDNDIKQLLQR